MEGRFLLEYASELDMNLCLLDMRGCGESKGNFTTLGIKEYKDVHSLIKTMQKRFKTESLILYGRSMGAATLIKFITEFKKGNSDFLNWGCINSILVKFELRFY